jgi:hypothetical protein
MKRTVNVAKLLREARNRKERRTIIVGKMTGNPNFTTPVPSLASITTLIDALDDAQQALDGTEIKTDERNVALEAFNIGMADLQAYVASVCSTDTVKILSSGFDVRDAYTKAEKLPAPTGVTVSNTQEEGELKIKVDAIKKKLFYLVEGGVDASVMEWEPMAQSSKSRFIISGLIPGVKYRIRVRVVNVAGISAPSDEVSCRTTQF